MTDALVSGLEFSRGKGDTEVAWVDALITARDQVCRDVIMESENEDVIDRAEKILTLEPLPLQEVSFIESIFHLLHLYFKYHYL